MALAGPASAQAPRGGARAADVATAIRTDAITVTPLGGARADAAGLLPPSVTGLPRDIWAGSRADALARRIEALPRTGIRAADRLAETLMLAEADPPAVAAAGEAGEAVLIARIDQLVARGLLDAAQALMRQAGGGSPERRRRAFDVALLTGDEDAACAEADPAPNAQGDYARRVFCLVRQGDWPAAALVFDGAVALGRMDPLDASLLSAFLDPEMAEGPPPPPPARPTPLQFRLYDALGEPMPTAALPVAFARADLRNVVGWKAQVEAAERLARSGALEGADLYRIATSRRASASGGIWDRVAAIQALDAALDEGDAAAAGAALPTAWAAMVAGGTEVPLAEVFAPRLGALALTGRAAALAWHMGLLTADYEARAGGAPAGDRLGPTLAALARGEAPPLPADASPLERAVAAGFEETASPASLTGAVGERRLGEALLGAIEDVAAGTGGDLGRLTAALRTLRAAGLEDTARRAALQLLVLTDRA